MTDRISIPALRERDYLTRTIATVRNHRDADNCWPQWANIFADEIERLWEREAALMEAVEAANAYTDKTTTDRLDVLLAALARFDFGEET